MLFFFSPTQLHAGEAPVGQTVRVGGLVVDGSVRREPGDITVQFDLTECTTGILPDLFREGQGSSRSASSHAGGVFTAEEVLARHDETYMPPEVAAALQSAGRA
jgi:cytochrome c-type biogenesis protein CcmE